MIVMDAVMANVDRHAGNYGFLVDNDTGEILRMAPLFDQNMACLPMMMEHDDFDEYLSMIGPKIGASFVSCLLYTSYCCQRLSGHGAPD